MDPKTNTHHHHILPYKVAFGIGASLLILTIITVAIAHVDLGSFNFLIAMVVASIKASLVALFFMNLKYDKKENLVIFVTSFLFLAIFLALTVTDLFFRGDVYVRGPLIAEAKTPSKLKNPWVSTPELVAHGRELFQAQCVACHGAEGKGNGPAAGSLNPHPRNFTAAEGWKNGRHPSQVFKTLKEGIPGSAMASFATLPSDDRWALAAFVLSLGPTPPEDTPADLAKIGMGQNGGGAPAVEEEKTIPIEVAMKQMEESDSVAPGAPSTGSSQLALLSSPSGVLYQSRCLSCHGDHGQGANVRNLGVWPRAEIMTQPFSPKQEGLRSQESFNKIVTHGLPGDLMPGNGQLSSSELRDLYQFLKNLPADR